MSESLTARDLVEWEMFYRWRADERERLETEARTRSAAANARRKIL